MSALQMGGGRCFLRASLIVTLLFSVQLCHLSYGMPDWYNCTADNCVAPDCMCASIAPPGGLAPEETPQFILITHDDAINPLSDKVIRSVTNGRVNPNGCNVPATWFTLQLGSDCAFVKKLWEQNHEIALHTVTHAALYLNYEGKEAEMMGVQEWLNSTCGIPLEDLVGYRTPYLVHNAEVREIMEAEGLLYDSSMISVFSEDSLVSTKPGERVFPFTMDHGIPINCNWNYPDGQCDPQQEKYPGLWEIPLWELQNQAGDHLYTMDPKGDVFSLLQENFKMNYDNNRAPFGIFVHATWFDAYTTGALNKFLDWAQEQPDVWLVTATQLLKWMQDPVPASQMGEWLTCRPVNLTAVNAEARCQLYTVQDGDSSYNIATKFGIVTDDLLSENPEVGSGDALSVGDELRIPPFGSDCVGDAVKRVTGPGQVELTEVQPTEGAQGTETVADICGPGLYENLAPIAGINVTMMLEGRPEVAFQTDLKSPLESAIALGLGIENYHVKILNTELVQIVEPPNVSNQSELPSQAPMPRVIAEVQICSSKPRELYKNATAILQKSGEFEGKTLSVYQLSQYENPEITAFENNEPLVPTEAGEFESEDAEGVKELTPVPDKGASRGSYDRQSIGIVFLIALFSFVLQHQHI